MARSTASREESKCSILVAGKLGLIAGSGSYPVILAKAARTAGVQEIVAASFVGETREEVSALADQVEWMRVGQLGRLIKFFKEHGVRNAIMAGQIAPGNLFDLRPDLKALLILGKLKRRNAESIFGAIADELASGGIVLADATTFLEDELAGLGAIAGPTPSQRILDDIAFGMEIAREISRLDIGQTVVVRNGTVLAVEGFDGTDATIRRGGELGRGKAIVVKVSKKDQDFRFDVPVVGQRTIEICAESGVTALAVEAGRTLLLERETVIQLARQHKIALYGTSYAATN